MFDVIPLEMRRNLQNAILRFNGADLTFESKKDLLRTLKIAEEQGWTYGVRDVYGGGKEVNIADGHDVIAFIFLNDYKGTMQAEFMFEYLRSDFEPTQLQPYNEELDAELRNEETLYGWECPRPWRDVWYVAPDRQWTEDDEFVRV